MATKKARIRLKFKNEKVFREILSSLNVIISSVALEFDFKKDKFIVKSLSPSKDIIRHIETKISDLFSIDKEVSSKEIDYDRDIRYIVALSNIKNFENVLKIFNSDKQDLYMDFVYKLDNDGVLIEEKVNNNDEHIFVNTQYIKFENDDMYYNYRCDYLHNYDIIADKVVNNMYDRNADILSWTMSENEKRKLDSIINIENQKSFYINYHDGEFTLSDENWENWKIKLKNNVNLVKTDITEISKQINVDAFKTVKDKELFRLCENVLISSSDIKSQDNTIGKETTVVSIIVD